MITMYQYRFNEKRCHKEICNEERCRKKDTTHKRWNKLRRCESFDKNVTCTIVVQHISELTYVRRVPFLEKNHSISEGKNKIEGNVIGQNYIYIYSLIYQTEQKGSWGVRSLRWWNQGYFDTELTPRQLPEKYKYQYLKYSHNCNMNCKYDNDW